MIQTAFRDPVPPAIGGRNRRFDQIGEGFDAPEVVNDLSGKPFHASYVAINAMIRQALSCVLRDGISCPDSNNGPMDVETLKRLMAEHGERQVDIARMLEITADKMSKTLKGRRRLTLEEGTKLARYFGMVDEPEPEPKIPIIGLVSAGEWREAVEHVRGWLPSPDKTLSKDSFAVVVEGDSMDLVAAEGEAIIVDPRDRDLLPGKYYVIRNSEGETTFKQYCDHPARLEPCSTNPRHATIYPGRDIFTVVGRARKRVADL